MRKTLESYPNLVKEFDFKKNSPLTPNSFSYGMKKKIWWKCIKGHEWFALINNRTRGDNCPYCSGRKPSKENNLKLLFPSLAKEWHSKKNGNLKPENFTKGSGIKVWWKCIKGHEWSSTIVNRTLGQGCPYCAGQKVSKENNFKHLFPNIAKDWHPTKNGNLKPENFTKGSSLKFWWKCIKGHEWKTTIYNRTTTNTNCPKCSNQSSRPEFRILSELETIFKKVDSRHKFKKTEIDIFIKDINVGIEFDGFYFHKNKKNKDNKKNKFLKDSSIKLIRVRQKPLNKLNNFDVVVGKNELTKRDLNNIIKSIYNFCNKNHKISIKKYLKYTSFINEKSYKKYLSYFPAPIPEKSLALFNNKFIKEWNFKKNFPLTPESFSYGSGEKVWWLCSNGHEWKTKVSDRTSNNSNCPYCSGRRPSETNNLTISNPKLLKEWHPTKNKNLTPKDISKGSNKEIWWLCLKGHEWLGKVNNRNRGHNCPYCSGRRSSKENNLKFLFPKVAEEWHSTKNGNLTPEDVTKGSSKKIWWLCLKGHEWLTSVKSRTRGSKCPICKKISS